MSNIGRRQLIVKGSALAAGALVSSFSGLSTAQSDDQTNQRELPERGIEGFIAPEIELDYWIDKEGKPSSFSVLESRGKWVFLKCFQNWCPGCHSSGFPTLKAFSDRFHDHPDVAIAGIQTVFEGFGSNTVDDVRKLQLRYELPIVMGHDPGDEKTHTPPQTMMNYRTGGTPWLILIAPNGGVVFNDFHVDPKALIDYVEKQVS